MTPADRPFLAPSRRWDGQTIGLYGGSFNPAHAGHLHVSLRAIKHLRLDALWWLISPHNPLKEQRRLAPIAKRVMHAQTLVQHPRIHLTSLEQELGFQYSIDTLAFLKQRFVRTRFIWVIGADNLLHFDRWKGWQAIFHALPIAVVDRPGYSLSQLKSRAAHLFGNNRVRGRAAHSLSGTKTPAWVFLHGPLHRASASALRADRPQWLENGTQKHT